MPEEFAVGVDDPYVVAGLQDDDAESSVVASDGDVAHFCLVAQGDRAVGSDDVVADACIGFDVDLRCGRLGFGAFLVGGAGSSPVERSMWSRVVVVGDETVELSLQRGDGVGGVLRGEELFEGLMPAFDLAARLRMVGPRVFEHDAKREQFGLERLTDAADGRRGGRRCRRSRYRSITRQERRICRRLCGML